MRLSGGATTGVGVTALVLGQHSGLVLGGSLALGGGAGLHFPENTHWKHNI
jgi:hypothetical protein